MEDRSELQDYVRSGFVRGHMSPSGNMPTATAQFESFSQANMVSQNPNDNQNLCEGIESSVRYLTSRRRELFVMTGPIFDDSPGYSPPSACSTVGLSPIACLATDIKNLSPALKKSTPRPPLGSTCTGSSTMRDRIKIRVSNPGCRGAHDAISTLSLPSVSV
jgi:hypothetical protein